MLLQKIVNNIMIKNWKIGDTVECIFSDAIQNYQVGMKYIISGFSNYKNTDNRWPCMSFEGISTLTPCVEDFKKVV